MEYRHVADIIRMSQVARYHEEPGPIPQNIAAHSWGVAFLILQFHPNPSIRLVRAAIVHDLSESLTSDVSFHAKRRYPPIRQALDEATLHADKHLGIHEDLDEEDLWWLRWADLTEAALWCKYLATRMGIQAYGERWRSCEEPLKKMMQFPESPDSFIESTFARIFTDSIFYPAQV